MLRELQLKNLALIDQITISFSEGLHVITGESGAGKSLLLDGLSLVLGAKGDPSLIAHDKDLLEVEALFDLSGFDQERLILLPEDLRDQEEIVIHRSVSKNGRSRVQLNGRLATLSMLEQVSSSLVNICGQHLHVRLLHPKHQRELLDSYGKLQPQVAAVGEAFRLWQGVKADHETLLASQQAADRRLIELEEIVADLDPLAIQQSEKEELQLRIKTLAHQERISELCTEALTSIEEEGGVSERVRRLATILREIGRYDPQSGALLPSIASLIDSIEECERELARYNKSWSGDSSERNQIEERLTEIARLERKYRTDAEGLRALLIRSKGELDHLTKTSSLADSAKKVAIASKQYHQLAATVSAARRLIAKDLEKRVTVECSDIALKGAVFLVRVTPNEPSSSGTDEVEFLFSGNAGQPPKELKTVASGGELSRLTLVLRKVLRDRAGVNVLVFDEVDSGISGQTARKVGQKLHELSRDAQVICITHLPQVASLADAHSLVVKSGIRKTKVEVNYLDPDERIEEIARMLAGEQVTDASRFAARELLERS